MLVFSFPGPGLGPRTVPLFSLAVREGGLAAWAAAGSFSLLPGSGLRALSLGLLGSRCLPLPPGTPTSSSAWGAGPQHPVSRLPELGWVPVPPRVPWEIPDLPRRLCGLLAPVLPRGQQGWRRSQGSSPEGRLSSAPTSLHPPPPPQLGERRCRCETALLVLLSCVPAHGITRLYQRSLSEEGETFPLGVLGWWGGPGRLEVLHGGGGQRHSPSPSPGVSVLADWRPALHLAALDCADETNSAVCRDFNIPGFPTVRVRGAGGTVGGRRLPTAVCVPSSGGFSDAPGLFKSQPLRTAPSLQGTPALQAERDVSWEAE